MADVYTFEPRQGVLKSVNPIIVPQGYCSDSRHFRFTDGISRKMSGNSYHYSSGFAQIINGLYSFQSSSTEYVIAGSPATINKVVGGVKTQIGSGYTGATDNPWSFTSFGTIPIMANGINAPQKFVSPYTALAAVGGSPPTGQVVRTFQRHLMILGQPSYPQRVSWSDIDDYETWAAATDNEAGSIDLYESKTPVISGDCIGDFFTIYTKSQIHIMQYIAGTYIFARRLVEWDKGLWAAGLLVSAGDMQYFFDKSNIYDFDGTSARPIGDSIKSWLYPIINETYITRSFSFYNKDAQEIWFVVPVNSSTIPNLACIYNISNKTWALESLTGYAGCNREPASIYPIFSDVENKIQSIGSGTDAVDSTVIETYIDSPDIDAGNSLVTKTSTYLVPEIITSSDRPLQLYLGTKEFLNDDIEWGNPIEFNPMTTHNIGIKKTSRYFRIRLKVSIPNTSFDLLRIHLQFAGTSNK